MLPLVYILLKDALSSLRSLDEKCPERNQATQGLFMLSCLSAETRAFCLRYSAEFNYYLESSRVFGAIFGVGEYRNVLVHGPAGAGKSTLSNKLYRYAKEVWPRGGEVLMLAPTQAAAELLEDGCTIHSFLSLKKTKTVEDLTSMWGHYQESNHRMFSNVFGRKRGHVSATPELIIFDEVSMIGVSLLRCIDFVMRNRSGARDSQAQFGGARVVFVGDFCQLPPVCDSYAFKWDEWPNLNLFYASLTRSLRQDGDQEWYQYLQRIRRAEVEYIRSPDPQTPEEITMTQYEEIMNGKGNGVEKPLVLSADNAVVEELNMREFGRIESPVAHVFGARDSLVKQTKMANGLSMWSHLADQQPTAADMQKVQNCWRLQNEVLIKVGARYVITFNLNKERGIYNGQTCVYEGEDKFRLLSAKFGGGDQRVGIRDLIATMAVPTQRIENVFIQREQVALRLGYAQTIHRSQGMTLSNCLVDLRTLRCAGQYYVAMSRVRSRRDIRIMAPTNSKIRHSSEVLYFLRSNDLLLDGDAPGNFGSEDEENDPIGEDDEEAMII